MAFLTVSAMEDTELMCIHRNKFLQICEMYPKSAKLLKYKAYLRRKFVRSQKILSQKMTSYSKKKEKKEEEKKNDGEGDGNLLHTLSKGHKPIKKFMTYKEGNPKLNPYPRCSAPQQPHGLTSNYCRRTLVRFG